MQYSPYAVSLQIISYTGFKARDSFIVISQQYTIL